ncbi:phytoene desaturase family protein [Williamsia sterculiae]|uniref:Pyridine nucleotide-disulfide oxidoreductase domain-containing protein 2 n=1 Tax=Williamsia sterculiae TaxID=1344003 RepID=A0A1N7H5N2_9NOCA|nr:NAD(P)/FAD-dependent oxidoreductase [Williamsia sterculiae]SIS20101.1 Phytoene dehydrogenase-related protein [Williamsia sterculiae]
MSTSDAVVIGAGHNGLISAIRLADAGWDVTVLESRAVAGGAVASAELVPGYRADLFSAFYPLAVASPGFEGLELEAHGLRWSRAPIPFGHPAAPDDDQAAVVHPDPSDTAAELSRHDARDGDAWMELVTQWRAIRPALLNTLFRPFPPTRGPLQLLRAVGTGDALRLARFFVLPANRMVTELFRSEHARLLLLGNAMHADIPLDAPGSGMMGYLLTMLAQDSGFPVPVGGAGELAAALVRRAESAGVRVLLGHRVDHIDVSGGRATGVLTADGHHWSARRAVLADVSAPMLYNQLLAPSDVPSRLTRDIGRFDWDTPVVKVDYALRERIPWNSPNLGGAGTVHLGADTRGLVRWMADLNTGVVPRRPFLLFGQMTTADPTRSPAGTESAWAYTHLPRDISDDDSALRLAAHTDAVLEEYAPGFGELIVGRHVHTPSELHGEDQNLHAGAVNGGTAQLFQQLIFRPTPGLGGAETAIRGLYLASAAAHPGGGVHGACGNNAALAALACDGLRGLPRRRGTHWLIGHLSR